MATVTQCFCLHLGKKSRLLFCSYIKTNGLFQYQTRTAEWFDTFFPECTSGDYYVKNKM